MPLIAASVSDDPASAPEGSSRYLSALSASSTLFSVASSGSFSSNDILYRHVAVICMKETTTAVSGNRIWRKLRVVNQYRSLEITLNVPYSSWKQLEKSSRFQMKSHRANIIEWYRIKTKR